MEYQVYVSFDGDRVSDAISRASMADDPDELRKLSQAIERGNEIWRSWAISNGGSVINLAGDAGRLMVPAEKLVDLPDLRIRYMETVQTPVSVGVGAKLSEADQALQAAKKLGGDQIRLFDPDVPKILAKSEELLMKSSPWVRSAAFHHVPTNTTYETGGFHDIDQLPEEVQAHIGTPHLVEGFVTHNGQFVDRKEAARLSGTQHGESTELGLNTGVPLLPGQTPGGENLGLRKAGDKPGPEKRFHGGQAKLVGIKGGSAPEGAKVEHPAAAPSEPGSFQMPSPPPKPRADPPSTHSRPFVDEKGRIWYSQKQAAEAMGVNQGDISNILKGNGKSLNGHTFKYLDDKQVKQVHDSLNEKAGEQGKSDKKEATQRQAKDESDQKDSALKKQIVSILKVFKEREQELEQIKEQDPELYKTLVELVNVMDELAREKFGSATPSALKKSDDDYFERTPDEEDEETKEETSEVLKAAIAAGLSGRHERNMPVGTTIDPGTQAANIASTGTVKVQDPNSGGMKHRSVMAGKVMSQNDGTPTSSRRPNPPGGPTPDSGDPANIADKQG